MIREKLSIAWFFALEGVLSGAFSACSEIFKERNGWDEQDFGWMIFICVAAGIAAVPGVAKLCDRFGSAHVTLVSALLLIGTTPFMAKFTAQDSYLWLIVNISIFGVLMAALDICVNAQACCFEKLTGQCHMGFMHALYAVGAVLGSLIAGLLIRLGYTFFQILLLACATCGAGSLLCLKMISKDEEERLNAQSSESGGGGDNQIEFDKLSAAATKILRPLMADVSVPMKTFSSATSGGGSHEKDVELSLSAVGSSSSYEFLLVDDEDDEDQEEIVFNHIASGNPSHGEAALPGDTSSPSTREKGYTLLVALTLTLCVAFLVEGSVGDWGAIFLAEECHVPRASGLDALGFAVFNTFVVLSRLLSDRSEGLISRPRLLQLCAVGSLIGFWLTALAPRLASDKGAEGGSYSAALTLASVGFAVTGLALGPVSAIVMAASGNIKSIDPTAAVSTVSGVSYFGYLAGPVLLGVIAQHSSLSMAFSLAGILIATVYPLAALM